MAEEYKLDDSGWSVCRFPLIFNFKPCAELLLYILLAEETAQYTQNFVHLVL